MKSIAKNIDKEIKKLNIKAKFNKSVSSVATFTYVELFKKRCRL